MSYLIYTDLLRGLLDPKLLDPGSTLVHTARSVYVETGSQEGVKISVTKIT